MAAEELMTAKKLSEYIQMNIMTIFKLARKHEIPAVEVEGEWRFQKELIDKWLEWKSKARFMLQ